MTTKQMRSVALHDQAWTVVRNHKEELVPLATALRRGDELADDDRLLVGAVLLLVANTMEIPHE